MTSVDPTSGVSTPPAQTTIYGNYVAPAVSSRGGGAWHIQGGRPTLALCGKRLTGDLSRMSLHVSLLECPRCMALGEGERFAENGATVDVGYLHVLTETGGACVGERPCPDHAPPPPDGVTGGGAA